MVHFDSQKGKQTYQKTSLAKQARLMKRLLCQKTVYAGSRNKEEFRNLVRVCRNSVSKAKAPKELTLASVKGNKLSISYINSKSLNKKNVCPLLSGKCYFASNKRQMMLRYTMLALPQGSTTRVDHD